MKMDVGISLPKVAIAAIAAVAIAFVVLLAWIGGERTTATASKRPPCSIRVPPAGRPERTRAAREDAISSCSRWP